MTIDIQKLRAMAVGSRIVLPVKVQYDSDGGYEEGWWSRWAYRIPGVVNFIEEVDETWPPMIVDPEMGREGSRCPRSEYVAAALNAIPELLDELERLRADASIRSNVA